MKIVNNDNIPEVVVRALQNQPEHITYGNISVTTLIDSPQVNLLKKVHAEELEMEASSALFALMGTALHKVMEYSAFKSAAVRNFIKGLEAVLDMAKTAKSEEFKQDLKEVADLMIAIATNHLSDAIERDTLFEQSMIIEIDGMSVSGTADMVKQSTKTLIDNKYTTIWSYIYPNARKKYAEQLNIYAYILRTLGIEIEKIQVLAFFRDWSKGRMKTTKDYPKQQIMLIDIEVWTDYECRSFIQERIYAHKQNEDGNIPCTPDEMWADSDTWAVKVDKIKKAHRVYTTENEADVEMKLQQLKNPKKEYWVEERKGSRKRCNDYCPVADFCKQNQAYLKQ